VTAERWLTPVDVRLLGELGREANLVHAARAIGVGRDRAVYRLERLARLFGGPVAVGRRGGPTPGATHLTPLGRRLLRGAMGVHPGANRWSGVYRSAPSPRVEFGPGDALEVAFRSRDGDRVTVEVDPEAFVVARRRVDLSARNALGATVEQVRTHADGTALLQARWGGRPVRVALTTGSVDRLHLAPGVRAYLYVKAVAVRRGPSRGFPRS
jgi:molybdopterin-binding protein/molybdate transport repressor ModE-like protein